MCACAVSRGRKVEGYDKMSGHRTSDAFTFAFEFGIFSHVLQENIIVCFAYIYLPFETKTKDGFFVIKYHNNNKTAGYNDKLIHHL